MKLKTNTRIPVSLLLAFCLLLMPIVAMAKKGDKNFKEGMKYEAAQQWEKAAQEFTLAVAAVDISRPNAPRISVMSIRSKE